MLTLQIRMHVKEEIALLDPDVVIHAAAISSVDECEKEYKKHFK